MTFGKYNNKQNNIFQNLILPYLDTCLDPTIYVYSLHFVQLIFDRELYINGGSIKRMNPAIT